MKKITSPERLDQRLVVVRSKGWMALFLTGFLLFLALVWALFGSLSTTLTTEALYLNSEGFSFVRASETGVVNALPVGVGESAAKGESALTLQTDAQQVTVPFPVSGRVLEMLVEPGDLLAQGEPALVVEREEGTFNFYAFLPLNQGQQLKEGMEVYIQPIDVDVQKYGSLIASITSISPFIVSEEMLTRLLGSQSLVNYFTQGEPVMLIEITPKKSEETASGFAWTTAEGPPEPIPPQSVGSALITLSKRTPMSYVLPIFGRGS